jgi:hypothetical protein
LFVLEVKNFVLFSQKVDVFKKKKKKKKKFIISIIDYFPLHLLTQIPLGFMAGHIAHLKNERY